MLRRHLIALLAAAAVSACAPPSYRAAALPPGFDAPYTLASGDRLRIIVFGQENLSNSYAVDGSGRISMPLIGPIPAAGQTTLTLERGIEGRLRNGYLREPKVAVEVETHRPFFILGEVVASGQYAFVNGMTAQTAVAIGGGFSPRGSKVGVDVSRMVNGVVYTANVPLTYPIRPGDTVVVRERFW